jgi:UDP-N-acetylmuramate--alanine ligase
LPGPPDISSGRTDSSFGRADAYPENIEYDEQGYASFDYCAPPERQRIKLNILGEHNVENAVAAITLCHFIFGVGLEKCAGALLAYNLAGRRFEYLGEKNGYKIIHDYAHHPVEISACLKGISKSPHNRLWVVFQCNSFTRARSLKDKYARCFGFADTVIVPDIFPGRDTDTGDIYAPDLVREISKHSDCLYIPTFEEIDAYLVEHAKPGDIVITLGSGTVNVLSNKLL